MDRVERIQHEAGRILEVARANDLSSKALRLGRWKVRDVVAHLGGVHRWADRIVTNRSMDGPGFTQSKLDGPELLDWFEEGAAALVSTLSAIDPNEACPNFCPGSENNVGWWTHRQLVETTVHRWDVEAPFGEHQPIDATVAADAVGEFLDTFVRARGKQTATAPLVLATATPPRSWTITLAAKPGRVDVTPEGPDADARLSGDAAELLLLLWNRLELDQTSLVVDGDELAVQAFLSGA